MFETVADLHLWFTWSLFLLGEYWHNNVADFILGDKHPLVSLIIISSSTTIKSILSVKSISIKYIISIIIFKDVFGSHQL